MIHQRNSLLRGFLIDFKWCDRCAMSIVSSKTILFGSSEIWNDTIVLLKSKKQEVIAS